MIAFFSTPAPRPATSRRVVKGLFSLVLIALLVLPLTGRAQQLSTSLRAGTRGIGVDLTFPISDKLNVRAGGTYFTYGTDGTEVIEDVTVGWEGNSDVFFLHALADWYPFGNAFRLSGGIVYNGLQTTGSFMPEESVEAGGTVYPPSEIGRVDAKVDFERRIAPYLGIGFGNPVHGSRFTLLFDVGVIYQGSPSVNLEASEMLTPTEEEADQIEENISWAQWYPVVSVGVSSRLF